MKVLNCINKRRTCVHFLNLIEKKTLVYDWWLYWLKTLLTIIPFKHDKLQKLRYNIKIWNIGCCENILHSYTLKYNPTKSPQENKLSEQIGFSSINSQERSFCRFLRKAFVLLCAWKISVPKWEQGFLVWKVSNHLQYLRKKPNNWQHESLVSTEKLSKAGHCWPCRLLLAAGTERRL